MLAGVGASIVWAGLEPFDRRVFSSDYSDVAMLGKALTRGALWPVAGVALHAGNGAAFGLAFNAVRQRTSLSTRRLALALALAEHVALFPLALLVDTRHPARGEPGLAPLFNRRGLAQATARHALFGLVLGRLAAPAAR
jgi:hypothetical protein